MLLHRLTQDKRKVYTSGQPDLLAINVNILSRCCPSKLRWGKQWMDDFIWIFVWCFIWAHIVDIAQMMGFALVLLIFALMCLDRAAAIYDRVKQECDLERLLDTPQKREDLKLEGNNTTFDFPEPEDEEPLTKVCPT